MLINLFLLFAVLLMLAIIIFVDSVMFKSFQRWRFFIAYSRQMQQLTVRFFGISMVIEFSQPIIND